MNNINNINDPVPVGINPAPSQNLLNNNTTSSMPYVKVIIIIVVIIIVLYLIYKLYTNWKSSSNKPKEKFTKGLENERDDISGDFNLKLAVDELNNRTKHIMSRLSEEASINI